MGVAQGGGRRVVRVTLAPGGGEVRVGLRRRCGRPRCDGCGLQPAARDGIAPRLARVERRAAGRGRPQLLEQFLTQRSARCCIECPRLASAAAADACQRPTCGEGEALPHAVITVEVRIRGGRRHFIEDRPPTRGLPERQRRLGCRQIPRECLPGIERVSERFERRLGFAGIARRQPREGGQQLEVVGDIGGCKVGDGFVIACGRGVFAAGGEGGGPFRRGRLDRCGCGGAARQDEGDQASHGGSSSRVGLKCRPHGGSMPDGPHGARL